MNDFIIGDYEADWLDCCVNSENIDYSLLSHKKLFIDLDGGDLQLGENFKRIVSEISSEKALEISVFEKENGCDLNIFWLFGKSVSGEKKEFINRLEAPALAVTDNDDISWINNTNVSVLLCKNVFGGGMRSSASPDEGGISVHDFFLSQLFVMTKILKGENGSFFSGYEESPPKGFKHIKNLGYGNVIGYDDAKYMYEFFEKNPDKRFFFSNTYGGKLSLLHEMLFKCLEEFDRICVKNNIEYFLGGGTLLGAVRHGGMILWDDDIDVMMKREEYEKFLSVVNRDIGEEFFFQSSQTDREYHSVFTKLRLNGTVFKTSFSSRFNSHQGIFIDIFVHDHTSSRKLGQKLHVFKTLFARSMVFHKWAETPMHFYGKLKPICKLATKFISKKSFEQLEEIQYRTICRYKGKNTGFLYDGTGEHLRHGAFPAKWLEETSYLYFNGREFPVPKNYKEYLTYSYGDYERWIPARKRKAGHDIIEVDFGKYDKQQYRRKDTDA